MKQTYETPVVEIETLDTEDVLAISIFEGKGSLTEITWDSLFGND